MSASEPHAYQFARLGAKKKNANKPFVGSTLFLVASIIMTIGGALSLLISIGNMRNTADMSGNMKTGAAIGLIAALLQIVSGIFGLVFHNKRHDPLVAVSLGVGTIISWLLSLTKMTFPVYIGAMIVAAVMRNIGEKSNRINIHIGEINNIGGICLSLFLGIAMITLKLWQLAELALPLIILLAAQTIFMFIFARFILFNAMGRDYDAAVISAGTCGFGMGATPNAMANMQAICDKYVPSVKAYLLIPLVGSLFADFINSLVITFFINLI